MLRFFANAKYDFIGVRRWAYGITAALILPGLLVLLVRGLNYSIEFTGGTLVQIRSHQAVDVADIRSGLDREGIHGAEIQSFGAPGEYVIRARVAKSGTDANDTQATAAAVSKALDAVLGGWGAAFAITAHSGYPITVQDSSNPSLQATRSTPWPDLIGDPEPEDQTLERWLNRDAFRSAARGTFGNAGVGIARAPGYWNADLSLSKRVATVGSQYAMYRLEAYNVFNHPNFGPPDRNIQSQNFGTITSTVGDPRIVQLVLKYYF